MIASPTAPRRRGLLVGFFLVAFALSWFVWLTTILQQRGTLAWHVPEGAFAYLALTVAALGAAAAAGPAGLRDLLARMFRWRVGVRWYLAALLVPLALSFAALGLDRLLGGVARIGAVASPAAVAAYFLVFFPKMIGTEELAWRGFALPRLQARSSALAGSVVLGVLWGLWHAPLFLMQGTAQAAYPFVPFVLFAVAESILVGWIFNRSRGSVMLTALFHAATDASLVLTGTFGTGDMTAFWIVFALFWLAAVAVVLVEGPATLAGRGARAGRPEYVVAPEAL